MTRLRVALFGTPSFALPTFAMLRERHDLVWVVTQPDRPVGRGMAVVAPPVAAAARAAGIELAQPERLRRDERFAATLAALDLDVAVTAAFGQILPRALLGLPRHGFLNVHASLLPRWRGAAPVQWALIAGDPVTGVSIMQTEAGLDTGPVRLARTLAIAPTHDAATLMADLARLGAEALADALDLLAAGALPSVAQDDANATTAPRLTREDGRVRWGDPAPQVLDRHRGVALWPGSHCAPPHDPNGVLKIHGLAAAEGGGPAGTLLAIAPAGLVVACGAGAIRITEVQLPGRPRVAAYAYAQGARLVTGVRFG